MDKVAINTSTWDAVLQASPIVQMTLLLLVVLSVVCWAVGITKWRRFKKIGDHNELFLAHFWKASSLDHLYEQIDQYNSSTLARVYRAAYLELKKLAEVSSQQNQKPQLSGSDNLERVIRKSVENEVSALESRLNWLATTGSTGPFIGLFGTVWGIMGSFHKIGATGNASLAVVAPGISEALVATAIGLAAAIPAVMMYNHFVARIRKEEIELNNFTTDFLNIVKRNFFKG
ncbi:MAG: protein TolQ [Bdellovibrionales bacterium]